MREAERALDMRVRPSLHLAKKVRRMSARCSYQVSEHHCCGRQCAGKYSKDLLTSKESVGDAIGKVVHEQIRVPFGR